ncbi:endolytic transglycosylase MltG [Rickettsiales endosymbiont of Stachyamoeba lipophora]|uniref:endolytic transglycosylase MltG n=1 Tax=Rickettsiales endosymbiont of Stachyamoeba lipophora TaxID=2486578 RepID=UPI000F655F88|nr:endolytic transglycosylase MltG [Rickettsiales endosymbiont of Stachyamoeba lipophora]AZL15135.1 endolytic transglycosylase MltG [Rickettsiales endosymbiont of Stachyamoeba lipophora]
MIKKLLIITLIISSFLTYHNTYHLKNLEIESFIINKGEPAFKVIDNLAKQKIISSPHFTKVLFALYAFFTNASIKHGEYEFKGKFNLKLIIRKITQGEIKINFVTIPEGLTNKQIIQILNNLPKLTGNIEIPIKEGSILPETYDYTLGDTRTNLLSRMIKSQQSFLNINSSILPSYITKYEELLTLASIIEKEAKVNEEREIISSVYHNRLKINMILQADPTLIYDIRRGEDFNYILTRKDIELNQSRYNTYKFAGLPPTPICNPGKASIIAALKPASTYYLYFVSQNNGEHYFAKNLTEHLENVRKYRSSQAASNKANK